MKKVKSLLFVGCGIMFLFTQNSIQKNTTAEIGYGLAQLAESNGYIETAASAGFGAIGAYAGAEYGAAIGLIGGPAGAVIGGIAGAL